MKLASLKHGRDGKLVVVSSDLSRMAPASEIAPTLQAALDEWAMREGPLRELWRRLDAGKAPGAMPYDPAILHAPLPRAYQWADGSAYVNHVELVRKARGAPMPPSFYEEPLIYQGGSDTFLAPMDPIEVAQTEGWGVDFEAEVAVILDDTPMGVLPHEAREHIRLVTILNDVSLRGLIPEELAKGFGFFQSKPSTAFAPVAVTPDALGRAWDGGKLHLPLLSRVNGLPFGKPNAGAEMTFDFGRLIAHAAKTRHLGAGTIIGSGTVSNKGQDGGPGRPIAEGGLGYSCIAEIRTVEQLVHGQPATPFLRYGDRVEIDMHDAHGRSIFGKIDQVVVPVEGQAAGGGRRRA